MKVLLALTAFALIMTTACSTGDASTTCANPNEPAGLVPVADVPEGTLLLAREQPQSLFTLGGKCGETTALPNGTQTWLAPDGSKAAAVLGDGQLTNTGFAVIDSDGTHTLVEWDRNAGFWPTVAWSSDGERVAYNQPATEEPAGVFTWDGGEPRRVYTGLNAWPIGFTSDGDVVLSPSMKQLKVVDSNGKELQAIAMPFDDFSTGYIVSPDGTKLAVMSETDTGGNGPVSTGLWLYDFDSREWTRLAEMGASVSSSPGTGLWVSANAMLAAKARKGTPPPTWSADGERLTYYRVYTSSDQVYHAELWLYDFGSGKDQLLSDSGWSGGWSPNGKYYAFPEGSPESIGLLGPNSKVEVMERGKGFAGQFDWAPDGRLLVSSGHDLRLYDPDTRETATLEFDGKQIGGVAAYPGALHASPSGRYFAVATSYDSGGGNGFQYGNINEGVYIIDTEDGSATRVIDKGGVYVSGWLGE